jgi:uncharacterized damage-inducible protein DinB
MHDIALNALRTRITGVFPSQIRTAIAALTDEQLWWRPNEQSNSIANLILHLTGSLNYFLNRNIGGIAYDRDRNAEFAERGSLTKAQLLERFDDMVARATRTFDALTPERLEAPSPEPNMHTLVFEDLMNIAIHLSAHTGQILWIAKMLQQADLGDLWMKSHRAEGAWPKRA